jgi:hypothetical protein
MEETSAIALGEIQKKEFEMFTKRFLNIVMIALVASMVVLFPAATSTQAARGGPYQNSVYPEINALNASATSGGIAYITFEDSTLLALVDTNSHTVTSTIDLSQYGCNNPERVRFAPGGAYLYILCPKDSIMLVFDTATSLFTTLDSTRKCNRVMLKEYLKRRPKIKAFPWAQV